MNKKTDVCKYCNHKKDAHTGSICTKQGCPCYSKPLSIFNK